MQRTVASWALISTGAIAMGFGLSIVRGEASLTTSPATLVLSGSEHPVGSAHRGHAAVSMPRVGYPIDFGSLPFDRLVADDTVDPAWSPAGFLPADGGALGRGLQRKRRWSATDVWPAWRVSIERERTERACTKRVVGGGWRCDAGGLVTSELEVLKGVVRYVLRVSILPPDSIVRVAVGEAPASLRAAVWPFGGGGPDPRVAIERREVLATVDCKDDDGCPLELGAAGPVVIRIASGSDKSRPVGIILRETSPP